MSESTKSIMMVGVGGRGIIRASDILCFALLASGHDVKKSEVHGMAQRGGSVTSQVRYGTKVYSPMAKKGDVDILVSFEKLETLRYLDYLKADAVVIISEEEIYPPSVNLGDSAYHANIVEHISKYFRNVKCVDAIGIARNSGDVRTANMAMLGALSKELKVTDEVWSRILQESFPEKALKANLQAFDLGKQS